MAAEGTGAIEAGTPRLAVEEGLAACGDTGDDLMIALARKLVSGEADDAKVEDIFRRTPQLAVEADHLLVDSNCERVGPEPAAVVAHPVEANEPIIELVLCGGLHGSSEQQQTLFNWAEFLANQPKQPKARGRNRRCDGPSLFDWALEREQHADLAAAGS